MTRDDIMRMAKNEYGIYAFTAESLERFAALVAAAERERLDLNAIHSCHAECQNPFCVRVREAVEHEREACALVAESYEPTCESCPSGVANAIRARGNT
jgi:hypothetical protein